MESMQQAIDAIPVAYADVGFSVNGLLITQPFTLSHNLGFVPTSWYIADCFTTFATLATYSISRTAWDANTISFIVYMTPGTSAAADLIMRVS